MGRRGEEEGGGGRRGEEEEEWKGWEGQTVLGQSEGLWWFWFSFER